MPLSRRHDTYTEHCIWVCVAMDVAKEVAEDDATVRGEHSDDHRVGAHVATSI